MVIAPSHIVTAQPLRFLLNQVVYKTLQFTYKRRGRRATRSDFYVSELIIINIDRPQAVASFIVSDT